MRKTEIEREGKREREQTREKGWEKDQTRGNERVFWMLLQHVPVLFKQKNITGAKSKFTIQKVSTYIIGSMC